MKGQVFINDVDVSVYGVSLDSSALSTLMTPPSLKDWVSNECRDENGERYLKTSVPKQDKRELSLTFNLLAPNVDTFHSRYASFCQLLTDGILNIRTKYQPEIVYRCIFVKCSQFTEFALEMASFSLSLIEPDPTDRAIPASSKTTD